MTEIIFLSSLIFLSDALIVGQSPCVWRGESMHCVYAVKDSNLYTLVGSNRDGFTVKYVLRKHENVIYEVWTHKRIKS